MNPASRRPTRRFSLAWLATSLLVLSACGGGGTADNPTAADATASTAAAAGDETSMAVALAVKSGSLVAAPSAVAQRWSAPSTWGGQLPAAGEQVLIPAGRIILLDTATAALGGLVVQGTLLVSEQGAPVLRSRYVMVSGKGSFQAGSAATPFAGRLRIELTGADPTHTVNGMGTKFVGTTDGGRLALFGAPKRSWTRLNAHASKGQTQILLADDPVGWKAGDELAIAPTDYEPLQAETRRIKALNGRTVTLDAALAHAHWGVLQTISGITIDQRAEVANLSRNITVTGQADSANGFGGHMMFMAGSPATLSNVEITRMGQLGIKGRYPVHFHLNADSGSANSLRNSVIHHTFQRGLVLHQSNGITVADNVVYDTVGMQYFLEDGVEVNNTFERNLGLLARVVPDDKSLSSERIDRGDGGGGPERVAIFWITNQHNTFRDNVAVGVQSGWGYAFRDSDVTPANRAAMPLPPNAEALQALPQLAFSGNVARTIARNPDRHFNLGYGPEEAGSCLRFGGGGGEGPVPVTGGSATKCVNAAVWGTGGRPLVGVTIADARTAVVQDQGVGFPPVLKDARVVRYSANDPSKANVPANCGKLYGDNAPQCDPLSRRPFTEQLFEATDAGATHLLNVQVVGNWSDAGGVTPIFNAPASASATGDYALSYRVDGLFGLASGSTTPLTVNVVRKGYTGPITVRLPDLARADSTSGLTADTLTIPANATSGTMLLRALNTQTATDVGDATSAKVFPLNLLASGGSQTKVDTLGVVELASSYVQSRPGANIAAGYTTNSPRGLSNMEMNRGVNFAFDGTNQYAETSGPQPWAEIAFDHRQKLRQMRLWQPQPDSDNALTGNFVIILSDFWLIDESTTLDEALKLPFVTVIDVPGLMGTKASPTVINLPAGTTARSARVWKRTAENLRIQEWQMIGD